MSNGTNGVKKNLELKLGADDRNRNFQIGGTPMITMNKYKTNDIIKIPRDLTSKNTDSINYLENNNSNMIQKPELKRHAGN